ncbi:MAG TPA: cupredoxin domain-containing protein [Actinomycetota bacterium]|nr:cupredoxin domain-containing protein [Actinomycetota bacterium]
MRPALRDRLVMPILLPLGILGVIALVLFGFSRILLSLTPTAATVTAIVVATGIVVTASVAAGRKQVRLSTLGAMLGVTLGVAMLAGGVALAVVGGTEEEPGGGGEKPVVTLAAANIAFEPTSLTVPGGKAFTLRFHNEDANTQHNVQIFDDPEFAGTPLFSGALITGVRQTDYEVDALEPGAYFFRCEVHPTTMTGKMQATAGEPGGPGGPGETGPAGGGVTVVAQNIAFDTSTIRLEPVPTTITFENRDAGVQHDIAIYSDSSLADELFSGDLVTGPATVEYDVPALPPGEHYFQCNVHPNMNGSVVVSDAGGAGGPPPEPTGPS